MDPTAATHRFVQFVGWGIFALGGFVSVLNFYLSFLRYPLHRKLHPGEKFRWVSGFPFIGSMLVVFSLFYDIPLWAKVVGILVALFDTGGVHWFIASVVAQIRQKEKSAQQK